MPEIRCFGSIVCLTQEGPDDRNRVLFSNPDVFSGLEKHAIEWGDRRNVSARLSYDECKSWPVKRRLEVGNTAGNRYMTPARFDLDLLTAGRDTCAT